MQIQQTTTHPFNPFTNIAFSTDSDASVSLRIYDPAGRLLRTIVQGQALAAGYHQYGWNGTDDAGRRVASGVYFARVEATSGGRTETVSRKLVSIQ